MLFVTRRRGRVRNLNLLSHSAYLLSLSVRYRTQVAATFISRPSPGIGVSGDYTSVLLGGLQSVVDLDSKAPNGALTFRIRATAAQSFDQFDSVT